MYLNHKTSNRDGLALFGGSFDPFHLGHLAISKKVAAIEGIGRVVLIPSQRSPLKVAASSASARDRIEMVALAIKDEAGLSLDSLEIDRGGISYSALTVKTYRERFKQEPLYWVLGEDQFLNLPQWHSLEYLVEQLIFLVIPRAGSKKEPPEIQGLRYQWLDLPLLDYSSTQVRAHCRELKSIKELVPSGVEGFISVRGLYLE